ncbi:hypothetical protein FQA39_LY16327 [Lamprigera yunnana]|nr:hypothetical protein FQA39_LY16327 [Lamprigera yunnana]
MRCKMKCFANIVFITLFSVIYQVNGEQLEGINNEFQSAIDKTLFAFGASFDSHNYVINGGGSIVGTAGNAAGSIANAGSGIAGATANAGNDAMRSGGNVESSAVNTASGMAGTVANPAVNTAGTIPNGGGASSTGSMVSGAGTSNGSIESGANASGEGKTKGRIKNKIKKGGEKAIEAAKTVFGALSAGKSKPDSISRKNGTSGGSGGSSGSASVGLIESTGSMSAGLSGGLLRSIDLSAQLFESSASSSSMLAGFNGGLLRSMDISAQLLESSANIWATDSRV